MVEGHKKEKFDWECPYCHKEFKTSEECDEHELNCKKKPVRIKGTIRHRIDVWEGFKLGFGIGLGLLVLGLLVFIILTILGISFLKGIQMGLG